MNSLTFRIDRKIESTSEKYLLFYSSGKRRKTISQNKLAQYNLFNDIASYFLNMHDVLH